MRKIAVIANSILSFLFQIHISISLEILISNIQLKNTYIGIQVASWFLLLYSIYVDRF